MFFENSSEIAARRIAARKWLEEYAEYKMNSDQPRGEVERALMVIVLTKKTSDYLAEHDPQALKQAQKALNGKSWEEYCTQIVKKWYPPQETNED